VACGGDRWQLDRGRARSSAAAHLIGEFARPSWRGGGGADKGATAEAPRHQTSFLKLIQCASDGAARRLKGRGQLPFGRQPVAFAIGAGFDGPLEIG
jgi:hypothetical protein